MESMVLWRVHEEHRQSWSRWYYGEFMRSTDSHVVDGIIESS